MTYLKAAELAKKASGQAMRAIGTCEDPGIKPLAESLHSLAAAVEELARSMHRDK